MTQPHHIWIWISVALYKTLPSFKRTFGVDLTERYPIEWIFTGDPVVPRSSHLHNTVWTIPLLKDGSCPHNWCVEKVQEIDSQSQHEMTQLKMLGQKGSPESLTPWEECREVQGFGSDVTHNPLRGVAFSRFWLKGNKLPLLDQSWVVVVGFITRNGVTACLQVVTQDCCYCCSVAKSCPAFCDPLDYSMPGFPVPCHLLEFAQVPTHCIDDAIQPSHKEPLLKQGVWWGFF